LREMTRNSLGDANRVFPAFEENFGFSWSKCQDNIVNSKIGENSSPARLSNKP
jgi:hypothetical protein